MTLTPSEQIMYNVIHITMLNEHKRQVGTATGFMFGFCKNGDRDVSCLVTNRHVLSKCAFVRVSFTKQKADGTPDTGNLYPIIANTRSALYHPNPEIDLAILPIGSAIHEVAQQGQKLFYIKFTADLIPKEEEWKNYSVIENVLMAGYPKGFRDQTNNLPIFRSGTTATHPALNFNNKPIFLVDMPCYEGCSGSPIAICDEGILIDKRAKTVTVGSKVALLGVQFAIPAHYALGKLAQVQSDTAVVPVTQLYLNLGFVIRSTELLVFEDMIRAQLNAQSAVV